MEKPVKIWICRISLVIVALAVVSVIASISFSKISEPYRFYSFVKMPPLIEHFAAGELVDGKVVEQKIDLSEIEIGEISVLPEDSSFCVGALMATYGDRRNKGDVRFSVEFPGGRSLFKDIPVNIIRDNKYLKICFDNLPVGHLQPGEYLVRLEGLGGTMGSSVTVWLTKYIKPPFNSVSYVNGSPAEGALVVGFLARQHSPMMQAAPLLLVALYAGMLACLIFILFTRKSST